MTLHTVRVVPSAARLPREEQLTWHLAAFAAAAPPPGADVAEMAGCRVIDDAAVALAAINRGPVATARAMALGFPRPGGATLFGLPPERTFHAQWAAWANATAVRELDFHDMYPQASHPGDNIPTLIAVAQQMGRSGADLTRAIAVAYAVQVALARGIALRPQQKEQTAHLCPATTAGLGTLLGLPVPAIYQALNLAVLLAFSPRQTRKGDMTSWKAFVPGFSGKLAIDAVDRAMRGEAAPSPVYEGESGVIAYMLGGPEATYQVEVPAPGEPARAILETYTKAHSAVYHAQVFIDLAFELRRGVDLTRVREVVVRTNTVVHRMVGSGAEDPAKADPDASRETLDHSLAYCLAVALEDGAFHHEHSYATERTHRPSTVTLWHKIRSVADPAWDARMHDPDPTRHEVGGRLELHLDNGRVIAGEKAVADAHVRGARPFGPEDYRAKFRSLTEGLLSPAESEAFLELAAHLPEADAAALRRLNPALPAGAVRPDRPDGRGIFDHGLPEAG